MLKVIDQPNDRTCLSNVETFGTNSSRLMKPLYGANLYRECTETCAF